MIGAIILLIGCCTACIQGVCNVHSRVVQQRVVRPVVKRQVVTQRVQKAVPVVRNQQFFYSVGDSLRTYQVSKLDTRMSQIEQLLIKIQNELTTIRQAESTSQAQTAPPPAPEPTPASAIVQFCAECHNVPDPPGGFAINGTDKIICQDVTKAIRAVAEKRMPKDKELTREQRGAIVRELLNLEEGI